MTAFFASVMIYGYARCYLAVLFAGNVLAALPARYMQRCRRHLVPLATQNGEP